MTVSDTHAVVRLKAIAWADGRLLRPYGQFAGLAALPLVDALALVEAGLAKLPAGGKRSTLRAAVERQRADEVPA